jgi:hypothetical protein
MLLALAETLLTRCNPSPTAFFDWLNPQISDDLLRGIAQADYGYDIENNLKALLEIRNDGIILSHKCVPNVGEVLQLTQYSEPDRDGSGYEGHLRRAFSAATLIRAGVDPANGRGSSSNFVLRDPTIVQLIRSVLVLDSDAIAPALRLLVWSVLQDEATNAEAAFLALGVLLLEAAQPHGDADEHWLCELSEWVIAMEAVARWADSDWFQWWDTRWLLGLNYADPKSSSQELAGHWQSVSLQILVEFRVPQPPRAAAAFFELAERLTQPGHVHI